MSSIDKVLSVLLTFLIQRQKISFESQVGLLCAEFQIVYLILQLNNLVSRGLRVLTNLLHIFKLLLQS